MEKVVINMIYAFECPCCDYDNELSVRKNQTTVKCIRCRSEFEVANDDKYRIEQELLDKMIEDCRERIITECEAIEGYDGKETDGDSFISKELHTLHNLLTYKAVK